MSTTKAVVLDAPALEIPALPIPTAWPGQVLIKVAAFGINRSKLPTRLHMEAGVATGKIVVLTRHAGTQSTRP